LSLCLIKHYASRYTGSYKPFNKVKLSLCLIKPYASHYTDAYKPFNNTHKPICRMTGLIIYTPSIIRGAGIATAYGLDDREVGVRVPVGSRSSLLHVVEIGSGPTQPPIQLVPGALSLGVKRLGCEADHSPPTSAEVTKMWIYTSTPPYAFTVWCLIS
jgi:hypothetical protein